MSFRIEALEAIEILDSRGRPTVSAAMVVNGHRAEVSVPSGASTGAAEARELRDGDPARYAGLGCRKAVANIEGPIASRLIGESFAEQAALDTALLALDGTPEKSRLGANAILATSLAFARSCALARGVELFAHFASIAGTTPRLPQLTINLFSGGKHAGGQVAIQDILLVPVGATSIAQGLEWVARVVRSAQELLLTKYRERPLKADEGGLAPAFLNIPAMFDDAVACIERAGFRPGADVALAVDVAASHAYSEGRYHIDGDALDSAQMIDRISGWLTRWPILSVEDGLAESDGRHWPALNQAIGGRAMVLGDDLLCTNPQRIRLAIEQAQADALLLKVNQIGTLTEALEALRLARSAGWKVTVSARSGETEDDWLADLATGWAGDQIKVGSVQQSDRLAKYNRLLKIERTLSRGPRHG